MPAAFRGHYPAPNLMVFCFGIETSELCNSLLTVPRPQLIWSLPSLVVDLVGAACYPTSSSHLKTKSKLK